MRVSALFRQFAAISCFILLILPLSSPLFSNLIIGEAEAADGCSANVIPIWDENVANVTLEDWKFGYLEMDTGPRQTNTDLYSSSSTVKRVEPLTEGFHVSKVVENGTSSGIRINLTTGYTYTFCITTAAHNSTISAPIDVYLITASDWSWYEMSFSYFNEGWERDFVLSDVPPEWRGGFTWRPYRDVHAYENLNEVTFSTSLDHLETRIAGGWSGSGYVVTDEFYLVVDGWDNGRDTDAPDPNVDVDLDITIMTEEKLTLPTWTVTLVCMTVMISLLAVPMVVHRKYHNLGIANSGVDLMPAINTESELGQKDYSVLE